MRKILFSEVNKKFGDKEVLKNLTLDIPDSGFVCITGPSGSGKTTIFNLITGLISADSGTVEVNGRISAVFQEDRLLPWESAVRNVSLPLGHSYFPPASKAGSSSEGSVAAPSSPAALLTEAGLGDELNSLPSELSGGMARRVSIARALAVNADIYIMDEPTRGLDDTTRRKILDIIHRHTDLARDDSGHSLGRLLIMITHNPDDAVGAEVLELSAGTILT